MFDFFRKKSTGTKAIFKIGKMHCVSCGLNIDGALEELDGVISASTNYARASCEVEYHPQQVTRAQLKKVIISKGYEVNQR